MIPVSELAYMKHVPKYNPPYPLLPCMVDDYFWALLLAKPVDQTRVDLFTHSWIYHVYYGKNLLMQTSKHNSGLIERWMNENNLSILRTVFPRVPTYFSRSFNERCFVVVSKEPSSERYGFFVKFSSVLCILTHSYSEILLREFGTHLDYERVIDAIRKALIAAEKSPICYVDEVIPHFELRAPSGLKYLAVFRLFQITVEETDTEIENKKQKAF